VKNSDIIFVCLPTPFNEEKLEIDLSIYDDVMEDICTNEFMNEGKVVVIKSTVVPGTTDLYSQQYEDVNIVFNPEFLTETNYLNDFINTDRIIIGGVNDWAIQSLIMLYRSVPHFKDTPIIKMSTTAAEIVKYQSNVLMATKVAIANVFYDLCEKLGVKYDDVKDAVGMDKRIGQEHIGVSSERGFGGKCFPKDLGAIIGRCRELDVDCKLLEEVFYYNDRIRKVKDWQEIAGATVGGR
ncbi:unnamed protein product, partial [marine sediment metagenome]